ncbi:hypothetical protein EDD21DRAFT_69448 [Dissophora ornata]|nr:hypothetical protein EDD21DRAFT_69448 [Dissophora ornata]
MHANSTQIQVQIPAAYYSLGSVALSGSLGFGSGHSSMENSPTSPTSSATTPLHPYHPGTNTLSNQYHSSQHHHHSTQQSGYHSQQQQHYSNGNAYHSDMQKTIPMQHQVDIYQPPHQALDSDLMNPIVNRQLNNQHASNYHSPYNYHQHYSSSYHYNASSKQQQPQQIEQQVDQQPRSNTSTPTPTLASNLSTVSSASTPSLSSNTITLQGNRQASPASSSATTSSAFHVPASPDQLTPLANHSVNMTQAMSNWTANDGKVSTQFFDLPARSFSPIPCPARRALGYKWTHSSVLNFSIQLFGFANVPSFPSLFQGHP